MNMMHMDTITSTKGATLVMNMVMNMVMIIDTELTVSTYPTLYLVSIVTHWYNVYKTVYLYNLYCYHFVLIPCRYISMSNGHV